MPIGPDFVARRPEDPYSNLMNISYSAPTEFMAGLHLAFQSNTFKTLGQSFLADPNIPSMFEVVSGVPDADRTQLQEALKANPVTEEEINEAHSDRPGLEIPKSVNRLQFNLLKQNWDDEAYYNFVASQPASNWGRIAAFGGNLVGGFFDPVALTGGGITAKIASKVAAPLAANLMSRLAVKETIGSNVAMVATNIVKNSFIAGAGFGGYQGAQELGEQTRRASFDQPSTWIESLQRVGQAIKYGGYFGAGATFAGNVLLGFEKPIVSSTGETTGFTEFHPGVLGSKAFQVIPKNVKSILGRYYKPWSEDADVTAREDAIGQAFNGQEPNVNMTLRQGAIDEARNFRERLKENNVDLDILHDQLDEAKQSAALSFENLRNQSDLENELINEAKKFSDQIHERPEYIHDEKPFIENIIKKLDIPEEDAANIYRHIRSFIPEKAKKESEKKLSQDHLLNQLRKGNEVDVEPPLSVKNRLRKEQEIKFLEEKAKNKSLHSVEQNKALKRAEKLRDKLDEMKSVTEEVKEIESKLIENKEPISSFDLKPDYRRLVDLARINNNARNVLMKLHLSSPRFLKTMYRQLLDQLTSDLFDQWRIADSMQRHITGEYDAPTKQDVENYVNHLRSNGIGEINYDLPENLNNTIDESLNGFPKESLEQIMRVIPNAKDEIESLQRKRDSLPTFKEMTKSIVNCLLRNSV